MLQKKSARFKRPPTTATPSCDQVDSKNAASSIEENLNHQRVTKRLVTKSPMLQPQQIPQEAFESFHQQNLDQHHELLLTQQQSSCIQYPRQPSQVWSPVQVNVQEGLTRNTKIKMVQNSQNRPKSAALTKFSLGNKQIVNKRMTSASQNGWEESRLTNQLTSIRVRKPKVQLHVMKALTKGQSSLFGIQKAKTPCLKPHTIVDACNEVDLDTIEAPLISNYTNAQRTQSRSGRLSSLQKSYRHASQLSGNGLSQNLQPMRSLDRQLIENSRCLINFTRAINSNPQSRERSLTLTSTTNQRMNLIEHIKFLENLPKSTVSVDRKHATTTVFQKHAETIEDPKNVKLNESMVLFDNRDYDYMKQKLSKEQKTYYRPQDLKMLKSIDVKQILTKQNGQAITAQQLQLRRPGDLSYKYYQQHQPIVRASYNQSLESNLSEIPERGHEQHVMVVDMLSQTSSQGQLDLPEPQPKMVPTYASNSLNQGHSLINIEHDQVQMVHPQISSERRQA